ncbi:hypothetical protein ABYF34_01140 [Buchananella felis]|uniref:hypothetical protein n=1 Tax=Buchananella felis TaxID=3231492 RepID=UPI003526F2A0
MNEIKQLWLSVGTVSAAALAVAALAGAGILASQGNGEQDAAAAGSVADAVRPTVLPTGVPTAPTTVLPTTAAPAAAATSAATGASASVATGGGAASGAAGGTSTTEAASAQAGPQRALTELVDAKWLRQTARATGVPERALAAYAGAAIHLEQTQPACRLGWNTLAAIGQVESEHGSLNGAKLTASGEVKPGIRGVQLRGQEEAGQSLARIPDTDGGRVDDDPQWDRAVGPMQFLPGTWASYASDGNADGVASPDQLDDAALAAARYLCSAGRDLSVAENWIAAVKAYNDSAEYNNRVADAAQQLADKSPSGR